MPNSKTLDKFKVPREQKKTEKVQKRYHSKVRWKASKGIARVTLCHLHIVEKLAVVGTTTW